MNSPTCLRCQDQMVEGFMIDLTHGGLAQAKWCPGVPQPSFWTGLKGSHVTAGIKTITFRCPACGYLESYAPNPT